MNIREILLVTGMMFTAGCGGSSGSSGNEATPAEAEAIPSEAQTEAEAKPATEVDAFKATIYPILRAHCQNCHSEVNPQGPTFAASKPEDGLKALYETKKINVDNPEKSRLVLKPTEGHNCWTTCPENSREILDAVKGFFEKVKTTATPEKLLVTASMKISDGNTSEKTSEGGMSFVYEAESGMRSGLMISNTEATASDGTYIYTKKDAAPIKNLQDPDAQPSDASVIYSFNIQTAADYSLWVRGRADEGTSDSFYVRVNGQLADTGTTPRGLWNGFVPLNNQFTWSKAPVALNLAPGVTTITFDRRELGAQLDVIALTTNPNFDGSDSQPVSSNASLSFNLEKILGVEAAFVVDIIELTADSYMLSSPRIIVKSGKLHIKSPKILVNGVYQPHHNAFNMIDKKVSAPGAELGSMTMIVVREHPTPAEDDFSFSFESLEVTK